MTEGSVTRTKRVGTRFFKNPPQPHMCIQDFLRGSIYPCYVNVLSWDKIAIASCPFERLPLYGGMKINPPRTERPEVAVFFVLANPSVLRQNGKNATDPKEQSILIELLLDFIEAMNEGVVFMRQYKILNDRDITGELKEIWMAVQSDRAKPQNGTASDEVKRPMPQYSSYQDVNQDIQKQPHQQKKQQQQLLQQQSQQQFRPMQPQQHLIQQMHHLNANDDKQTSQPPHYQSNYSIPSRGPAIETTDNFDLAYVRQPQTTIIAPTDRIYQSRLMPDKPHYNNNRARDRFMYRDPMVSSMPTNQPVLQQPTVPYPAPQYQPYQQLPRQMGAYTNPNIHSNPAMACPTLSNTGINPGLAPDPQLHYDHYYLSMRLPEKRVCAKVHHMQQLPQPQLQMAQASPVPPYESSDIFYNAHCQSNLTTNSLFSLMRFIKPHTNTPPKNSPHKRQVTSPTHLTNAVSKDNCGTSKSPIKVLQRDSSIDQLNITTDTVIDKGSVDVIQNVTDDTTNVQVTGLDEDEFRTTRNIPDNSNKKVESSFNASEPQRSADDQDDKKQGKRKIMGINKQTLSSYDSKSHSSINIKKDMKSEVERSQDSNSHNNRLDESEIEDKKLIKIPKSEHNGFVDEYTDKQIENHDDTRVSNGTSIIKHNNLMINVSMSDDIAVKKSSKVDGQPNNFGKDKEIFEMYAILRNTEVTTAQDDLTNDITQMSIKDCTDASEIGAVSS